MTGNKSIRPVRAQDSAQPTEQYRALRKAEVFYHDQLAGVLEETGTGFKFTYDPDFLKTGRAISLSLPLQAEPFESAALFSFFAGLNSEGWYRDIVCATKKIDRADEFGILLVTGENTVGAVTVRGRPTP